MTEAKIMGDLYCDCIKREQQLHRKLEIAEKALRFYADDQSFLSTQLIYLCGDECCSGYSTPIELDDGKEAKAALEAINSTGAAT